MNIERLRLFIAVAESLSFTEASKKMHLSQSNVSRNILELEDMLYTELFERTTRSVKLTPTGNLFLVEAKQILQSYDSIIDRVTNLEKGHSGSLTVGYMDVFTQSILPKTIRSFRQKYPLVDFQLKELTSEKAKQAVLEKQIDIGFFVYIDGTAFPAEVQNVHVNTGYVNLIVSDDHPLANQKVISADKLMGETIFTYDEDVAPTLYNLINNLCITNGFSPNLVSGHRKPGTIVLKVQSGLGVAVISSIATSLYKPERYFKSLKIEGLEMHSYMDLIWRKGESNPCIYNFVKEVFETMGLDNGLTSTDIIEK